MEYSTVLNRRMYYKSPIAIKCSKSMHVVWCGFIPLKPPFCFSASHWNSNSWVIQQEMFQIEDENDLNVQQCLQADPLEWGIFASDFMEFHHRLCLTHNPITEITNKSSSSGKERILSARENCAGPTEIIASSVHISATKSLNKS